MTYINYVHLYLQTFEGGLHDHHAFWVVVIIHLSKDTARAGHHFGKIRAQIGCECFCNWSPNKSWDEKYEADEK